MPVPTSALHVVYFLLNFSPPVGHDQPYKIKHKEKWYKYKQLHLLKLKNSANQNAFMISLSTFHTRFRYTEFIISDIHMHAYRNAVCQMCTSSALSSAICSLPGACITLTLKGFSDSRALLWLADVLASANHRWQPSLISTKSFELETFKQCNTLTVSQ